MYILISRGDDRIMTKSRGNSTATRATGAKKSDDFTLTRSHFMTFPFNLILYIHSFSEILIHRMAFLFGEGWGESTMTLKSMKFSFLVFFSDWMFPCRRRRLAYRFFPTNCDSEESDNENFLFFSLVPNFPVTWLWALQLSVAERKMKKKMFMSPNESPVDTFYT